MSAIEANRNTLFDMSKRIAELEELCQELLEAHYESLALSGRSDSDLAKYARQILEKRTSDES